MSFHSRIDIHHWEKIFSLDRLRQDARQFVMDVVAENPAAYETEADKQRHIEWLYPHPAMVWGPEQIAVIEQLRRESAKDRGKGVAIDVCAWGVGEPKAPYTTKIGGRPYRMVTQPWPVDGQGRPLAFLAQFCFADSLDVLPVKPSALPGDVMLLFVPRYPGNDDYDVFEDDQWHVEWCRLGTGAIDDRHSPAAHLTPTYAELHRTVDYPESAVDDGLNLIEGGKLGGHAVFQQGDPELLGAHLCTLGSLNPCGTEWPLLNVPVNPRGKTKLDNDLLMLGDLGAIYFFIEPSGEVSWAWDCG